MTDRITFDDEGDRVVVPLTSTEQADYDAGVAAAPAVEAAAQTQRANGATLRQRAQQALAANANFLALSPALQQAQLLTHVVRLTKECNGLARLVLSQLDDVSGT
jgi:hypothetical protein